MREDDLTLILAANLTPVRKVAGPLVSSLRWMGGAALILAVGVGLSRIRPDFAASIAQRETLIEVSIAGITAWLAAFATFQLAVPGRDRRWALPPAICAGGWLALQGFGCWRDLAAFGFAGIDREMSPSCLVFIAGFGTPVLLLTLYLARHAVLLRPMPVALLAGLASAGVADAGLVLVDHPHAVATTLIWHGGASLVLTGIALLAGPGWMRRAMRWSGPA